MGCDNCTCGDKHGFSSPVVAAAFNKVLGRDAEALKRLAEYDGGDAA